MGENKEINQVEAGKNKNLFRGKDIDNGIWVSGYFAKVKVYSPNELFSKNNIEYKITPMIFNEGHPTPVDVNTLSQYTGCEDKNGKPIFEGDIVRMHGWWNTSGPAGYDKNITTVRYCHDVCGFTPMCNYDCDCGVYHDADECEIIGNIYDNPELLEVDNE